MENFYRSDLYRQNNEIAEKLKYSVSALKAKLKPIQRKNLIDRGYKLTNLGNGFWRVTI
jgi:DNA-binding MarR family transcriptional regulator